MPATPTSRIDAQAHADSRLLVTHAAHDHVYHARGGFIYTTHRLVTQSTIRPSAVILISALRRPFDLKLRGQRWRPESAVIRPQICRSLNAIEVGLVSVNVHPTHPAYPSFQSIDDAGVMPVDRNTYSAFDDELLAVCNGTLTPAEGVRLFDRLVEATLPLAPCRLPPHPLRPMLLHELSLRRELTLDSMASEFGVSYHRMSHLFNEVLGLSFRAYASFELMRRASRHFVDRSSLTSIAHSAGFTDSAHLSHTWRKRYGLSPSYVRDDNWVQAFY